MAEQDTQAQTPQEEVLLAIPHKDGCPNVGAEPGSDEWIRLETYDATRAENQGGGDVIIGRCCDCGEWAMMDREV